MNTKEQLHKFMESHVYAVWDFMCLLKTIRSMTSNEQSNTVWTPPDNLSYNALRLINEIYLCEETDILPDGSYASHLEIYLRAMKEVGADTTQFEQFLKTKDINSIPEPARSFVQNTFDMINTRKLHVIISAFTHGRELIIPQMFTDLVNDLKLEAPMFKYYLERHIEVDGDDHGPSSMRLLGEVVDNDPLKLLEVNEAKDKCIAARKKLWANIL